MRNIVSAYVERFLHDRRERLKFGGIVLLLAVIVVGIVFWRLSYVGVAMTNEVYCGMEEHMHDSSCYTEVLDCGLEESAGSEGHTHDSSCYETVTQLVCGLEEGVGHIHDDSCFDEDGNLICALAESDGHSHTDACYESTQVLICGLEEESAVAAHTHDSSCYELVLTCDIPEHTHSIECMMDETADVETYKDWEATLPDGNDLTGVWTEDLVLIAESQLGYTESTANFQLNEDGETRNGYTRYGAWYGNEYGAWDAMFVSFCLNYAGVSEEEFPFFPYNSGAYAWTVELEKENLYVDAGEHEPVPGDLIFLNTDDDNKADTVAVVTEVNEKTDKMTLIQGDFNDAVEEYKIDLDDASIVGFGILPEQPTEESSLTDENVTTVVAAAGVTTGDVAEAAEEEDVPETYYSEPAEEENASCEPEGIFEVTYLCDEPGAMKVDGPETADAGGDLLFYVTVDVGSGIDIAGVTANDEELMPEEITVSEDGEELIYTYLLENVEEDTLIILSATQVIDGSGSVGVWEKAERYGDTPDYTLKIEGVPTNTKISLDSPHVTLTTSGESKKTDVSLKQSLYYMADDNTEMQVAYLMLDENAEESTYVVTAYSSGGQPCDLEAGRLILDAEKIPVATVEVWPIQIDLLCFLDEENVTSDNEDGYTQILIGAENMSVNAQTFTVVGNEGDIINVSTLTGKTELYYGSLENQKDENGEVIPDTVDLTQFDGRAQIVETEGGYALRPLDANENPVEGVSIYMVYDHVYSFDLEVTDVVNEHTEDNGDTYLWLGGEFYIDQYHAQGIDTMGYTRSQNTLTNCGVWVQLGRIREEAVNGEGENFDSYANVTYENMLGEGVSLSGYDSKNAADTAETNAPYGVVGPYKTDDSEPVTTTIRVTGHVGDEFTTNEAFGTNIVYMVTDEKLQEGWINLGSHASDNGYRAWFYWIKDYYKLNNHEDQVEYLLIYENEESGEIRLDLDEMGSQGKGEVDDYWDQVKGLYTKRNSVIKQYMLTNQEDLNEQGVGFASTAGWMEHIQLRMYSTVEEIIDGVEYSGKLELLYSDSTPSISWDIDSNAIGFAHGEETAVTSGNAVLEKDNDQESKQYEFGFYINPEYAFDPEYVKITVTVQATGTLEGTDGSTIEYTKEEPLEYSFTLTEAQLREAYDDCPNSEGYDIAINLSEAAKVDLETSDQIILYKVWDDNSNEMGARDDVKSVSVTLERSKDGKTWETVKGENGEDMVFEITKPEDEDDQNTWSTVLTSNDLDITYTYADNADDDEQEVTAYYQFRIASEQAIENVEEGYAYTYTTGGLTVTNSLTRNTIDISGIKIWLDENGDEMGDAADSDLSIPESVMIAIFQDGHFYEMTEVTARGDWEFSFQGLPRDNGQTEYVYTLYELDATGIPVPDGGSILLDNNYYLVEIKSGENYGGNYDGYDYVVTNQYSPYGLNIYKYTGGEVEVTYAGAASGLTGSQYYLWRIDDETNKQEFASGNATVTGGMIAVSEWSDGTGEGAEQAAFSPTSGRLVFTSLLDGYTYYLTTGAAFDGDSAIKLTLTTESVSGGTALSGAEFIITRTDGDAVSYGVFGSSAEGGVWYLAGWEEDESEATILTTGSDGYIHVGGLEASDYVLEEVGAPEGYNLLNDSIEFTLGVGPVSIAIPVENLPAGELPRTGGMGTAVFAIAGLSLVTASAAHLIKRTKKRREGENRA